MKSIAIASVLLLMLAACATSTPVVVEESVPEPPATINIKIPSSGFTKYSLNEDSPIEKKVITAFAFAEERQLSQAISILLDVDERLRHDADQEFRIRLNLVMIQFALRHSDIATFNRARKYLDSIDPNQLSLIDIKRDIIAVQSFNKQYR